MSDSVEQAIEYQEQILDDLDDIKGTLDEESEYYDKKYQKEVLSSLKSLQKSLDSLNESDPVTLERIFVISNSSYPCVKLNESTIDDVGVITFGSGSSPLKIYVYNVSDYSDINISSPASYANINGFTCDTYYESISSSSDHPVVGNFFKNANGSYNLGTPDFDYLYLQCTSGSWDINYSVTGVYSPSSGGDDPLPEEPVEVVTTSSAVIIEGLDNLTQITTFQSFCSSLLIGIMLFLVFVKGLRK